MTKIVIKLFLTLLVSGTSAFQLSPHRNKHLNSIPSPQQLGAENSGVDKAQTATATIVLATYLLTNTLITSPAMATTSSPSEQQGVTNTASSIILSARSGGRAGGRASMSRPMMRSEPSSSRSYAPARSTTTIIQPQIGFAPAPTIVSPSPFGYGFGYNPLGGFGLGYGLGAAGSVSNEIRDFNQEREITRSKVELEEAKSRQAELEQRLKALENAQK
mmetsp:Transcript_19274/g.27473  ORF Transcript_19274/g.27473 Transcript_19274/m.27473 type:complete len:218 (+) Transcript_19274:144-797(+)|eukprot:CAMPEP_0172423312 /NCGR_PEP_ID=MMETSP1064-20121228/15177_1 /TAXON_ID=202472 /ORGANISM="Aulacoseira subarctica , Strain CCAP 1002/5" /LENGTH=217 /DNA_ID=CAMNT_0013164617 /DNA_START=121 /DNA_END=774 /DNA_ORIENTATION=-